MNDQKLNANNVSESWEETINDANESLAYNIFKDWSNNNLALRYKF